MATFSTTQSQRAFSILRPVSFATIFTELECLKAAVPSSSASFSSLERSWPGVRFDCSAACTHGDTLAKTTKRSSQANLVRSFVKSFIAHLPGLGQYGSFL